MIKKHLLNQTIRLKDEKGFTLTELLAVLVILGILAGLVSIAVSKIPQSSKNVRLSADQVTISTAVDSFFNLSSPRQYPIIKLDDTDSNLLPKTINNTEKDFGVRLLNFDAKLNQNSSQSFVPDFLKQIPTSSNSVSWRIDIQRGILFFASAGSPLIPPANSRFNVSSITTNQPEKFSIYEFDLATNKDESSLKEIKITIPQEYALDSQTLDLNTVIGELRGNISENNPWKPGTRIEFTGQLKTTSMLNKWILKIDYPDFMNTKIKENLLPKTDKIHNVILIPPTDKSPGEINIILDRTDQSTSYNLSDERWKLTIFGNNKKVNVIKNPKNPNVYRWTITGKTTIDPEEIVKIIPGQQSLIIK
ncbi:MAG: type II secretion system protein [SAR202 cluster bacterium]|nr:type II secretion system protein [SAR202 cluster bacterium]|tara:strand:- start:24107 stop:25195 length:1089 start_codon:yes stop_codon:yes gene_type:complete